MKVCFYIVSFRRDWEMLQWCARSIVKFARGDYQVRIGLPNADKQFFLSRLPWVPDNVVFQYFFFDEPSGQGFNAQQCVKCEADKYAPGFEHYIHVDSDGLFLRAFDVAEFFRNGRPIWYYGAYRELIPAAWPLRNWQSAVTAAIGALPLREYMRKFPIVIPATVYPAMRQIIERKHKKTFSQYVFSCKPEFPQTFAEFNTLGFVADIQGHAVEFVDWEKARDWDVYGGFSGYAGADYRMTHGPMAGKSIREKAAELGLI